MRTKPNSARLSLTFISTMVSTMVFLALGSASALAQQNAPTQAPSSSLDTESLHSISPIQLERLKSLSRQKNCFSCHTLDKNFVGPSYKDIAAHYTSSPLVETQLTQRLLHGTRGKWGVIPMPSNPQLSEAEGREIINLILKLK